MHYVPVIGYNKYPQNKSRRSDITTFSFKEHSFFIGEFCFPRVSDTRNPSRWQKVVQCKTTDGLKDNIWETCGHRKDHQADEVRIRLSVAVSDLCAADAQYHLDCYKTFMSKNYVNASTNYVNSFAICHHMGTKSPCMQSASCRSFINEGRSRCQRDDHP